MSERDDDELLRLRRATRLSKLRIKEVSSVDRGAGEGAEIVLMKRDDDIGGQQMSFERPAAVQRTSYDLLMVKARVLQKSQPHLSIRQAFERVYVADLVAPYKTGDQIMKSAFLFADAPSIEATIEKGSDGPCTDRLKTPIDAVQRANAHLNREEAAHRVLTRPANADLVALANKEAIAGRRQDVADAKSMMTNTSLHND